MSKADIILCEMSNLQPRDTGLPVYIWLDEMGKHRKNKHSKPRLKVASDNPKNYIATIIIEEEPSLANGQLDGQTFKQVSGWIKLNLSCLLQHWYGEISTKELYSVIKELQ